MSKRLHRRSAVAAIAAVAAILGPIGGVAGASPLQASSSKAPVVFAAIGPNSGSEYNPGPESTLHQMDVMADFFNQHGGIDGHPISVKFFDTESSPSVAATLLPKIKSANPKVLISCCFPAEMAPINNYTKTNGPVTFDVPPILSGESSKTYEYSAEVPSTNGIRILSQFMKMHHWTKAALIYDTTPGQTDTVNDIVSIGKQNGVSYVSKQEFDTNATSVSTQVAAIAQAKPQVIYLDSVGHQIATVFSALNASSLANVPVVTGDGNLSHDSLLSIAHTFPKSLYMDAMPYLIQPGALPKEIRQATAYLYKEEKIPKAQEDNIPSYLVDNFFIPIYAMQHVGWNASESKINSYIQNHIKNVDGLNGPYDFTATNHLGLSAKSNWGVVKVSASKGNLNVNAVTNLGATKLSKS